MMKKVQRYKGTKAQSVLDRINRIIEKVQQCKEVELRLPLRSLLAMTWWVSNADCGMKVDG